MELFDEAHVAARECVSPVYACICLYDVSDAGRPFESDGYGARREHTVGDGTASITPASRTQRPWEAPRTGSRTLAHIARAMVFTTPPTCRTQSGDTQTEGKHVLAAKLDLIFIFVCFLLVLLDIIKCINI